MKLVLLTERKTDYPLLDASPADSNSEFLSEAEEDELVSGFRDAGFDVAVERQLNHLIERADEHRNGKSLIINRQAGVKGIERPLFAAAFLDYHMIPYLGCTPYVHALVRNKAHTKLVVAHAKVSTPPFVVVDGGEESPDFSSIQWPAIVKPLAESASIGIDDTSVVQSSSEALQRAARLIGDYAQPAIVESFVVGTEVEVPVIADPVPRALGAVALTVGHARVEGERILTANDVYHDGYGFAVPPEGIDIGRLMESAGRAARALGIRHYARIDFRVDASGTPQFIEANTFPHIQKHSSFAFLAGREGKTYSDMLRELVSATAARRT